MGTARLLKRYVRAVSINYGGYEMQGYMHGLPIVGLPATEISVYT